jgi:hypothetical protein
MKRQKLARATRHLRTIHDYLCSDWEELEDEAGIPNRDEMARQFDELIERTERLICWTDSAERSLKKHRSRS